jgi:hypothetical protein
MLNFFVRYSSYLLFSSSISLKLRMWMFSYVRGTLPLIYIHCTLISGRRNRWLIVRNYSLTKASTSVHIRSCLRLPDSCFSKRSSVGIRCISFNDIYWSAHSISSTRSYSRLPACINLIAVSSNLLVSLSTRACTKALTLGSSSSYIP